MFKKSVRSFASAAEAVTSLSISHAMTMLPLSWIRFFTQEDSLNESEEYYDADNGGQVWSSGKYFFDASGESNLVESGYGPPEATGFVGPTEAI